MSSDSSGLERLKQQYPDKFLPEETVFGRIRPGDRIFIGTACGEPQHLVHALTDYVKAHPKAFFDAEIIQVWTLGVAPYTDERLKSQLPLQLLLRRRQHPRPRSTPASPTTRRSSSRRCRTSSTGASSPIDVALIQTSLPDEHGYVSLGVSVDIVKAAVRERVARHRAGEPPRCRASTVTASCTSSEIDFLVPHDEPLLEYRTTVPDEIAQADRPPRREHRRGRRHDPGRLREHAERHPRRRSARRSTSASTPSCSPTASPS